MNTRSGSWWRGTCPGRGARAQTGTCGAERFVEADQADLPGPGQISELAVQHLLQKNFRSRLTQITFISITVSFRSEGRSRVVTSAGQDAVDPAASGDVRGWQGGSTRPVS